MARRAGDPYGSNDATNDNGVTPDPYGTMNQPRITTQPVSGTTPQPGPTTGTNPYANGGTTPITVPPGLHLTQGQQVAGSGLPTVNDPTGAGNGPYDYNTDQGILSQLAAWSKLPGANPSLANDPNYWLGRIKATGGLRADNLDYWKGRGLTPEGPPEGATPSTSQSSPFLDTFRSGLLSRLQQLQQPTDPNSSAIAGPTAAYNLSADRGLAKTKQAQAEAAYAGHSLNTGGYQQAQTQADEQAAADKANFSGNLVNTAEQQRQSRLDQLLGVGSNQGTTEQLAGGQLGYQYSALQAQLNRDAILAALGGLGG